MHSRSLHNSLLRHTLHYIWLFAFVGMVYLILKHPQLPDIVNPFESMLLYGVRDLWFVVPGASTEQPGSITRSRAFLHTANHYSAAWNSDILKNTTLSLELSRKYSSRHKWLLEEHISEMQTSKLVDIYGGWQSHLFVWDKMSQFQTVTGMDLPCIILQGNILVTETFLADVGRIISDISLNWTIISLGPRNTHCKNYTEHGCILDEMSFGSGYIIRNSAVAESLFKLNNLEGPPLVSGDRGGIIGWRPRTSSDWITYYPNMNILYAKFQDPKMKRFTPL